MVMVLITKHVMSVNSVLIVVTVCVKTSRVEFSILTQTFLLVYRSYIGVMSESTVNFGGSTVNETLFANTGKNTFTSSKIISTIWQTNQSLRGSSDVSDVLDAACHQVPVRAALHRAQRQCPDLRYHH